MTTRRAGAGSFAVYAVSFGLLVAAGVVLFYGALGSSSTMVWTSVGLSVVAVVGTMVSLLAGRR